MNKIQVIAAVRAGKKLRAVKVDYLGEELKKEILRQCEIIEKVGMIGISEDGELFIPSQSAHADSYPTGREKRDVEAPSPTEENVSDPVGVFLMPEVVRKEIQASVLKECDGMVLIKKKSERVLQKNTAVLQPSTGREVLVMIKRGEGIPPINEARIRGKKNE